MFPQINSLFRRSDSLPIPTLEIPNEKRHLLLDAEILIESTHKDNNGNFIITNQSDKLNVIGAHFAATNVQNTNLGKNQLTKLIETKVQELKNEIQSDVRNNKTVMSFSDQYSALNPRCEETPNYFTSEAELAVIFKKLNNKKSAGYDNIPNIVLKHLPRKIIKYYSILFNNALNNTYFPTSWKTAKVIALLKKDKDAANPTSYRPISLLPNISKIFETLINKSLTMYCDKHDIIPESQFGFRYRHSTLHAISKFSSDICWALNNRECVAACFIDLEKAFDTVWLDGLFFKLLKKQFPRQIIKILWVMLHDKHFKVTDSVSSSTKSFAILDGLQQGTVNSPILFNIYNSDILGLFDLNMTASKKAIAFADDLLIYVTGKKPSILKSELQNLFRKIIDYYGAWKLKINTSKCETVLFRPKLSLLTKDAKKNWKNFQISDSEINGLQVPHKKSVKYLGVIIDFQLKYNAHLKTQLAKAYKAFHVANRLFYCRYLDARVKVMCYLLLIRPIITYGCPIWFNTSAGMMERIRVFERKCLRVCLGRWRSASSQYAKFISNEKIYNEAKVHRIDCFALRLIRDHFANAAKISNNSLIWGPTTPNPLYFEKSLLTGFIPPEAFIYLDNRGLIQDRNNIPTIYHVMRSNHDKKITYEPNLNCAQRQINKIRFDTSLPQNDIKDKHRLNHKKYWWLDEQTI